MSANGAAKAGEPAGNFNNVWIGSSVTSPQYARAVRDAYASNYVATQQLNVPPAPAPAPGSNATVLPSDLAAALESIVADTQNELGGV